MPIGDETFAYRSRLPHLRKRDSNYSVTFCTRRRSVLSPSARSIVLSCCVREHTKRCWLHCCVVMPDHVHLVLIPYEDVSLTTLIGQIKGRSSFLVNQAARRNGSLWQRDSFDRIARADEDLERRIQYVCDNPVRKGLVKDCDKYPWLWRSWRPAG